MKVYVAAPWTHRTFAAAFAERLAAYGHTITRDWWTHEGGEDEFDILREQAIEDMNAVRKADAVVVLQLAKSEGKAAETGAAIALGIPVIALIYDKPGNIFHRHPGVQMVYTAGAVTDALDALQTKAA